MLKYTLLALLARAPRHGYELKAAFERLFGGTWPLNVGQVYTVLSRLEQDGLVECEVVPQENVPDRKVYALTKRGTKELARWVEEPAPGPIRLRDEVFVKVLLQQTAGTGDTTALIWKQREDLLGTLAELSRLRGEADVEATALLLDGFILRIEADLKWLDLCEQQLGGRAE